MPSCCVREDAWFASMWFVKQLEALLPRRISDEADLVHRVWVSFIAGPVKLFPFLSKWLRPEKWDAHMQHLCSLMKAWRSRVTRSPQFSPKPRSKLRGESKSYVSGPPLSPIWLNVPTNKHIAWNDNYSKEAWFRSMLKYMLCRVNLVLGITVSCPVSSPRPSMVLTWRTCSQTSVPVCCVVLQTLVFKYAMCFVCFIGWFEGFNLLACFSSSSHLAHPDVISMPLPTKLASSLAQLCKYGTTSIVDLMLIYGDQADIVRKTCWQWHQWSHHSSHAL